MNLFNRKFVEDNKEGVAKAPSFDPYGQFKNTGAARKHAAPGEDPMDFGDFE